MKSWGFWWMDLLCCSWVLQTNWSTEVRRIWDFFETGQSSLKYFLLHCSVMPRMPKCLIDQRNQDSVTSTRPIHKAKHSCQFHCYFTFWYFEKKTNNTRGKSINNVKKKTQISWGAVYSIFAKFFWWSFQSLPTIFVCLSLLTSKQQPLSSCHTLTVINHSHNWQLAILFP